MKIEVSGRMYPTITTLREIHKAVIGTDLPSYEEDYETKSLRSRKVIRFTTAPQPEWMLIREACKRIVAVGEKMKGEEIEIDGVTL